ncbi:tetratricopeptide repeat protein [Stenotrophomonas sp. HITSZ_GD]|uniref:YfgM family protein n=1 Tax=Stenotrophomonas sp. HITSZ_GD TaxID=3037248 RepID=UPI00240DF1E4|nr:tetratricopeptide repeat protein [Stenotrophomonas sp. HITSZ_GD]MDG2524117.1 tetratricopeptide repeat protein [Stenotrophomonas sp. HITSZ_GD]
MAIDDLLDEHEQGERVRSWLRKNGAGLIGGVVVGLGLILGWQWWQKQQLSHAAEAGRRYDAVVKGVEAGKLDEAAKAMQDLSAAKAAGVYIDLAALDLAKAQVTAGKNDDAIKTLRGIQADGALKRVVDQRLAKLLIDANQAAEADKLLAGYDDGISLEIRGDAAQAQGQRDAARDLYTKALAQVAVGAPQRALLEVKLTDAGGTVPEPAEQI